MSLDDKSIYQKLDQDRIAESIAKLPDQIRQVIEDARVLKIPKEYSEIDNIVLAGMGGSNLGIRIMRQAFAEQIKVPINITAGYGVPAYVNERTLYIISSYSGGTEEPLSTYQEARRRGAKIIAITKDGENNPLKDLMLEEDIPGYIFKAGENPSGQPRLGLGYSIFGIALLLAKAGIIEIDVKETEDIIAQLEIGSRKLGVNEPTDLNQAKRIALAVAGKMPILVAAEHLSGNLHVMRNQINENAKAFSSYLILPDANHFAMEGLVNPALNKEALVFVFFKSDLYSARVKKRMDLTIEVVKKNGIEVVEYASKEGSRKAQCFELLQLGSWLGYYMGINYGVKPADIPWVDWFKEQLK
jgi:glucose/mannose-6-phosphate isomerase